MLKVGNCETEGDSDGLREGRSVGETLGVSEG